VKEFILKIKSKVHNLMPRVVEMQEKMQGRYSGITKARAIHPDTVSVIYEFKQLNMFIWVSAVLKVERFFFSSHISVSS